MSAIKIVSPISDKALQALGRMIANKGGVEEQKTDSNELLLLSASTSYFTLDQTMELLDTIHQHVDLFEAVLFLIPRTLAPEAVPSVLVDKWLSVQERNRVLRELGQFALLSWNNPTGHYTLDMGEPNDRLIALRLGARCNVEQDKNTIVGSDEKRHDDTSQRGDERCFRNTLLNGKRIWLKSGIDMVLPKSGKLEFDFVTTLRPGHGDTGGTFSGSTSGVMSHIEFEAVMKEHL